MPVVTPLTLRTEKRSSRTRTTWPFRRGGTPKPNQAMHVVRWAPVSTPSPSSEEGRQATVSVGGPGRRVRRQTNRSDADVAAGSERRGSRERGQRQPGAREYHRKAGWGGWSAIQVAVEDARPSSLKRQCQPDQGDATASFTSQAAHKNRRFDESGLRFFSHCLTRPRFSSAPQR